MEFPLAQLRGSYKLPQRGLGLVTQKLVRAKIGPAGQLFAAKIGPPKVDRHKHSSYEVKGDPIRFYISQIVKNFYRLYSFIALINPYSFVIYLFMHVDKTAIYVMPAKC